MKDLSLQITPKQGKDLIKEALQQRMEQHKSRVVGEVNLIMERLSVMQRLEEKTTRRIDWCKTQLEAINDGKFTINDYTGKVVFNDKTLNVTWDSTEQW